MSIRTSTTSTSSPAISIPYDTGRCRFANTDRAIGFLERGLAKWPDDWEMRLYLGFYLLNFRDDPAGAAEQFAIAAPIPGAPHYLKGFAARLFSRQWRRRAGQGSSPSRCSRSPTIRTSGPGWRRGSRRSRPKGDCGRSRRLPHVSGPAWALAYRPRGARPPSHLPPLPDGAAGERDGHRSPPSSGWSIYEHPKEAPMRAAQ